MATEEEHEKWFIELPIEKCIELLRVRTDKFIGNESTIDGYDGWLNYFKTLPITEIKRLMADGKESLTTEAYAALVRWADIIDTPSRIDKIYQAGLAKPKNDKKSISELASSNDKLGVLYAIRDEIAEKLDRGTGARDTASLAKEMANIMDLITEAERRQGPGKDTKLAELLSTTPPKRTRGKGARNTSYMSRTIKETEGA